MQILKIRPTRPVELLVRAKSTVSSAYIRMETLVLPGSGISRKLVVLFSNCVVRTVISRLKGPGVRISLFE